MKNTHRDICGNILNLGDSVAVSTKNGLLLGNIVDLLPKSIRVEFDTNRFAWAIGYGFKYGVNKNKTPSILATGNNTVRLG
jgi:hypothetical protein